ncbi:MAG: FecR family protein, partial [Candidatus Magnetominusculus sp. LBB02]|nr:FecR family protein [Candidatus Magnetominusculus sp. LBB02]
MIKKRAFLYMMLALLMVLFTAAAAFAATEIGKATFIEGNVDVLRAGNLPAMTLKVNDPIFEKDTVRTKAASKAELTFKDGNILRLAQSTRIDISEYIADSAQSKSAVTLPRGHVRAVVDKDVARRIAASPTTNRFEVHTPNAVAGVRGSDGDVMFEPSSGDTIVSIREGVFYVYNLQFPDKTTDVTAGNIIVIPQSAPPGQQRPVTNADTQKNERATDPGKKDSGQSGSQSAALNAAAQPQNPVTDSTIINTAQTTTVSSSDTNTYQPPVTQTITSPLSSPTPTPTPSPTPSPMPTPTPTPAPAKTFNFGGTITYGQFAQYNSSSNSIVKGGSITGGMSTAAYSAAYTPFSFTASGAFNQPADYNL